MNRQTSSFFWAQRIYEAALIVNVGLIIYLSFLLRRVPIATIGETILTFVCLSALIYYILERKLKDPAMGPFILTVLVLLSAMSALTFRVQPVVSPILVEAHFEIHVLFLLLSYGAFAISFIASLLHILLDHEIQQKRFRVFYSRLSSLPFFRRISDIAINVGLVFMSAGLAIGIYHAFGIWRGSFVSDPKFYAAMLTWVIYMAHLIGRKLAGWGAHQAASVSVIGFGWLLFSFLIISTFFTSLHDFS